MAAPSRAGSLAVGAGVASRLAGRAAAARGTAGRRRRTRSDCRAGRARASRRGGRASAACPAASRSSRSRAPCRRRPAPSGRDRSRRPRRRRASPARRPCVSIARRIAAASAAGSSRAMPRSSASPPAAADKAGDEQIVGGDDLRRADRLAGRDEFVAGREHGDPRFPIAGQPGMVGGGGERDVARGEPLFRPASSGSPSAKSMPAWRTLSPGATAFANVTRSPSRVASSWIGDRVGAFRQRRAGEDAHRLAGREFAGEGAAGRGFARRAEGRALGRRASAARSA